MLLTVDLERLDIQPGHRVLDAGCGEGRVDVFATSQGPIAGHRGGVELGRRLFGPMLYLLANGADYETIGQRPQCRCMTLLPPIPQTN